MQKENKKNPIHWNFLTSYFLTFSRFLIGRRKEKEENCKYYNYILYYMYNIYIIYII